MDFYKKITFVFILIIFIFIVIIKITEPVIERQIKNIFSDKKFSEKIKKELENSIEDFSPEKKNFYKMVIKKTYIKWKPLINEALHEAEKELSSQNQ